MKVGLIGAGRQGRRRAQAVKQLPRTELVIAAEVDSSAAKLLAREMECEATDNWEELFARNDVETVIITTPNHLHAPTSIAALRRGKDVLCEKPLARESEEARQIVNTARENRLKLKGGFTLRHHLGIQQAREWFDKGSVGQLILLRSRYGICGRPGVR